MCAGCLRIIIPDYKHLFDHLHAVDKLSDGYLVFGLSTLCPIFHQKTFLLV